MDQEYIQKLEIRIDELEASVRMLKRLMHYQIPHNRTGISQDDQLLTVNDVIEMLGLPRHIIYAKATAGEIPCFKIGKRYKFNRKTVLEWFESKFDKAAEVDIFVDKYLQKNILSG